MSVGSLVGVLVFGSLVALTLTAPRRPRWLAGLAYRVAAVFNEAPFPFVYLLLAFALVPLALGQRDSLGGTVVLGLEVLVVLGLLVIAWRGARERPVVERALDESLGAGWREGTRARLLDAGRRRPPLARILLLPFVFRPSSVARVRNVAYGPAGRSNLLDVYHHRSRPERAPVLVYFHGGGYRGGRKSFEARALLFRLASQGWVTISANYRLRPEATFHDHLADVKRVIAWAREHGHEYGADAATLFLAGSSAGGQLASIAALTQNDPHYQPGFEEVDTSVTAVASLYGWYGGYYELGGPTSEVGVLGHPAEDARRSSSPTGRMTRSRTSRRRATPSLTSATPRRARSCSRSSRTVSTRSTSSIPSGSRPSSTASRHSRPGFERSPRPEHIPAGSRSPPAGAEFDPHAERPKARSRSASRRAACSGG
jgi:acetyl esterase/lipase